MQLLDPPLYAALEALDASNCFFAYRWLLVLFKREFSFGDVLRLWEAMWASQLDANLHLYVCVAILERHRVDIMAAPDFDSLLQTCIELAGRLQVDAVLRDAETLVRYAGKAGAHITRQLAEEDASWRGAAVDTCVV